MSKYLRLFLTIFLMVLIGIANAQDTQWYGYARASINGESWQNKFITFSTQNPGEVQAVSETMPELWAATYVDGCVWFVTQTRSLCKAPFDEATQTFGAYETIVDQLTPYNLIIDMAYNPLDGMMYYLCQDSQYNSNLKRSSLENPSDIEAIGNFSVRLWTLAINSQGQAYGVAYEEGNLHEINLNDATTTVVGPTGKDIWYTQSMAFDMNTNELYWAQFATSSDHGFYQVNTETGAATSLGMIGSGTELTGLFMVSDSTPQPNIIDEIHVEGFTAPAWGETPDYDLEVASDAHYSISVVNWWWHSSNDTGTVGNEPYENPDVAYFMSVQLQAEEGYVFADNVTVYFNGDASLCNMDNSYGFESVFMAMTIDFVVTDPTLGIAEQAAESVAVWPNPTNDILYLNITDGTVVSVFDMTGRMVMQQRYEGTLDVSGLASGVYAVKIENFMVRFIKK